MLVIIQTDDARFDPAKLSPYTAAKAADIRRAVIDNLPHLERVIAIMSEPEARAMMKLHEAIKLGLDVGDVLRPPPDYVPPTRD